MRRLRLPALDDRLSTLLILLLAATLGAASGILSRVDNVLFDIGQKLFVRPAPPDIVIVAIDEESLSKLGRWPWSRRLHAALIDRLAADGARVIGVDLVFAEPYTADPPADALLAESIRRAGRVVLPVLLESTRVNGQVLETLPLPQFIEAAAALGRVHVELDEDGIARGIYLWEGVGAPAWPHFAQAVLATAGELPAGLAATPPAAGVPQPFALVRRDPRRIVFLGPPGHVRSLSYAQVLTGDFPPGLFRDKIVLVGATAAGMGDLLPTPVSGLRQPMPGVEFNANVIDAMRGGRLIREAPALVVIAANALLALVPLLWLPRVSPLRGLLASGLWFLGVMALAILLPRAVHLWLPLAGALAAALLAYPVWSWRRLEFASRFLDHELKRLRHELVAVDAQAGGRLASLPSDPLAARIQQVQAASRRLRHLQNERRETLAFISHDIRAPLASALMQVDEMGESAARLRAPLARALALAEDFLHTSRAEMLDPARFTEIDLTAVLHQAVDDAWSAAKQRGVTLTRRLPDEPMWLRGDFGLLHRAVLNLLLNAVRFAPPGSEVEIALDVTPDTFQVHVTDHGPGIAEAAQGRLFERFSPGSGITRPDGTGLGLYFVRVVAEKHGGRIAVASRPGKTRFTLTIMAIRRPES